MNIKKRRVANRLIRISAEQENGENDPHAQNVQIPVENHGGEAERLPVFQLPSRIPRTE